MQVGFDELGGKDDFALSQLEARLVRGGILDEDGDEGKRQRQVNPSRNVRAGGVRPSMSDEDSDFE